MSPTGPPPARTSPALLFAAPHIANVKSLGGGPGVLLPYFATGLLYGWAAWRSGSLFMSWGLHFDNNLFNLLVIGTTGDILKSAAPLQFDPRASRSRRSSSSPSPC